MPQQLANQRDGFLRNLVASSRMYTGTSNSYPPIKLQSLSLHLQRLAAKALEVLVRCTLSLHTPICPYTSTSVRTSVTASHRKGKVSGTLCR